MNSFTEQIFGYPTFGYWKFFNEDSAADVLDANPASITSLLYPTVPEDWKATMGPYGAAKSFVNSGRVTPLPVWLSEGEARTRNTIFEKGGYTGPLNWYVCFRHPNIDLREIEPLIMYYRYKSAMRGIDIPWKTSSLAADDQKSLDIPTVLVPGEHDYVCRLELQKPIAEKFLRNYRIEQFQCGHWIQHEKRDELVKLLEEFSGSL
ncbi:hypothetical protein EIK77_007548 [Talaromyces pinophilus]|nr:hypothetical protein EIK77_007548 [Talaromyces pinophilus]